MIEITIVWIGQLQRVETDIVECFVVDTERFVRVFNQLMDRKSCIIRFNDRVRDLQKNY